MTLLKHSLLVTSALILACTPVLAQQVGTAGAVNPDAQSAAPGGGNKTINVGANVVYRERITTSANGSVQLLFVDRTTLNIGPNSQVTIDEFVFDPEKNTGKMAATLTKGVMRFVGGQASHTGGATIKTPATTLGVRGGVVTVRHDVQNGTRAINHFGTMTAQTGSGTEVIRRPGFALNVPNGNTAPTNPVRVSQNEINTSNSQLTSKGGQTGGRREVPTDEGASKTGVGQANAPVSTNYVSQQSQNLSQTVQPNLSADKPFQIVREVQQVTQTGSQLATTSATTQKTPPPKRWYTMGGNGAGLPPFIPAGFVATGTLFSGKTVGYGAGGTNPDGTFNYTSRLLSAGLSINGVGASQNSAIYVLTADIFPENPNSVPGGGFVATSRRAANFSMGRASGATTPVPGGMTFDSDYSPTSLTVDQNNSFGNTITPDQAFYYPGGGGQSTYYNYTGSVTRTPNEPGLGDVRPTGTLFGFVGGLMRTISNTTNNATGPSFPIAGGMIVNLSDASRFGAEMFVWRDYYAPGSPAGPADDFDSAEYKFGYHGPGTRNRSAYVDYNNFGARDSAAADSNGTSLSSVYAYGGVSETPQIRNENSLLVTNTTVNAQQFFPGVSFCQCDVTRWGFWSMDMRRTGTLPSGALDPDVQDRVHLGTWVAGQLTPAAQIPTTGIATFAGHAIGSFKAGSNEYLAAGNFLNTVNFGTNQGNFTITNLDGRNYAGTTYIGNANYGMDRSFVTGYGGTTAGPTANMSYWGQFMNGAAGPAHEMGGQFFVNGTSYVGSGIFAARR